MKTVAVRPNQTIFDLAVQHYGNGEAVAKIIADNPDLRNDRTALAALGIDYIADPVFYIDAPVDPGYPLQIDTDSRLLRTNTTREINTEITTFNIE